MTDAPRLFDVPATGPLPPAPWVQGPPGETCGRCDHLHTHYYANTYHHCTLIEDGRLSVGRALKLGMYRCQRRLRSPACSQFVPKTEGVGLDPERCVEAGRQ
jgi:hypothetical protein